MYKFEYYGENYNTLDNLISIQPMYKFEPVGKRLSYKFGRFQYNQCISSSTEIKGLRVWHSYFNTTNV